MRTATQRVLIVLSDDVHLMDVAGPAQVFTNANDVGGRYVVTYVGVRSGVRSHQGLSLQVSDEWPDLKPEDLLVVPGWRTQASRMPFDARTLSRIRAHWDTGGRVASVCAGALALAEAGTLSGQVATTHHELIDRLRRYPSINVQTDVLFTCGDRVHTSAGIASGIDLALHLVAQEHGPAVAARVARTMVVPAWRQGSATQQSVMLVHRDHLDDLAHRAQDVLDDLDAGLPTLQELGRGLGVSGRTLARRFHNATGMTPLAYATAVRRERAEQLHGLGWSWQSAARAVGYADARSLRPRGTT